MGVFFPTGLNVGATGIQMRARTGSAPVNTSPPSISFEGVTGYPGNISSSSGAWNGANSVTSIWQRNGVDISGSEGQTTYSMTPFDVGTNITLKETATNGSGSADASSSALVPDSQHAAWIDTGSVGTGIINSPGNPFQTPQSAYDALVSSFGESGTFTLVFVSSSAGALNVTMGNLTGLEIWVSDAASGFTTVDSLNCGSIGTSRTGGQLFLWKATIPTLRYSGAAGSATINGGTIIGNFNSSIGNLVLDGSPGENGGQSGDGSNQTGPDGPNGDDSDTAPTDGSDGSGVDSSGSGGATGGDGGSGVSITLNSIVVNTALTGSGGNGGSGGTGGNGAIATAGRGGDGGNYTGGVDGNAHPGGNGGNGGGASANGGGGGTGGIGGNGSIVSLSNGATITAGTVSLGAGMGGSAGGGGQPGVALQGGGSIGGSGVDGDGLPLPGNNGSMGSSEANPGAGGTDGMNGANGSIINI